MNNVIQVNSLEKKYKGFLLDNISFSVPSGYICGFIGQNGAVHLLSFVVSVMASVASHVLCKWLDGNKKR